MRVQASIFASVVLPVVVSAGTLPDYDGLSVLWSDTFTGSAGDSVNTSIWSIAEAIDTNDEVESYTKSTSNLQISGGGTVQFVPRKSSSGQWTSGRIESIATWTPAAGNVMQVEASLRMGSDPAAESQGMWPAVWMMGDSIHHGTQWPACGEIDIFETVNKVGKVYGTVHCTASACYPDGNEGLGGSTAIDDDWHTYAVRINRTTNDWQTESISFMKDGVAYFTITGATIGEEASWATLAHSPLYLIMNLAVGGSWPGDPNSSTLGGYGNMLEIEYAAVYTSQELADPSSDGDSGTLASDAGASTTGTVVSSTATSDAGEMTSSASPVSTSLTSTSALPTSSTSTSVATPAGEGSASPTSATATPTTYTLAAASTTGAIYTPGVNGLISGAHAIRPAFEPGPIWTYWRKTAAVQLSRQPSPRRGDTHRIGALQHTGPSTAFISLTKFFRAATRLLGDAGSVIVMALPVLPYFLVYQII